jgi:hypothetical protein
MLLERTGASLSGQGKSAELSRHILYSGDMPWVTLYVYSYRKPSAFSISTASIQTCTYIKLVLVLARIALWDNSRRP